MDRTEKTAPTAASSPPGTEGEDRRWHTLPAQEVIASVGADLEGGLSSDEAARRLRRYGPNALAESRGRSLLGLLADQFKSLIVALLLAAALLALALGENVEAVAILVVILLNTAIGFMTEYRAEQALSALREQIVPTATVIRDGDERQVPAAELVPGDVIVLPAGGKVPADGRVVEAARLQLEEAALTGESRAVDKTAEPVADGPLGDRACMVYLGTSVTDGRGRAVVTATGARTEVGKIGLLLEETDQQQTPLERKLAQLGNALIGIVLGLSAVIVTAGWLRGNDLLPMLEVGISLAIAAVPEGLPAVASMTLALGMRRMARMRALVRRLPAVEALGSTTVICSDKTGTLTRNEMTVVTYRLGEREVRVTGSGGPLSGEFRENDRPLEAAADPQLALALRAGALCNDASLSAEDGTALGDPTEVALVVAAAKAGLDKDRLEDESPRIGELPFSSESKRMVTAHRASEGGAVAYVKGAPSVIASACDTILTPDGPRPLTDEGRRRLAEVNDEMAGRALRVLALATKDLPEGHREEDLAGGLTHLGLVGMMDPLRDEAQAAIATCRQAGIRAVMITGDQQATAAEIGRQLGLDRAPDGRPLRAAHGRDLAELPPEDWGPFVADVGVFARVSPEDKLRIVEALQSRGEVVAMTGDGVNDAPALKKADIGIAMGIKGTEVAKEASAMVITDDNFSSIVAAVEQGRIIYSNILRFIHYLFSCNLSEVLVVFFALLLGWPLPLGALQILWLNMITDVFPAMALALEPSSPDAMTRPPRDPRQPLLNRELVTLIVWQASLLTAVTLGAFFAGLSWYGDQGPGLQHAVTVSFMTLALAQVFHAFSARSRSRSAFTGRLFTNGWLWAAVAACVALQLLAVYWPFLQGVLRTAPLTAADWALVVGCSVAPVAVIELVKLGTSSRGAPPSVASPAGVDRKEGKPVPEAPHDPAV